MAAVAVDVPLSTEWLAAGISGEDAVNGVVLGPDGYVYRPPPASKQLIIDLQVSVTDCAAWREVLALVENMGDLFEYRNTSTAVHRVAKYSVEAGESQLVLADPRFEQLLRLVWAKCKVMSARCVSDTAWGLAKLQCAHEEIFARLSMRTQSIMPDVDPQGLALIAWSFATIGRQDDALMTAIADESRRKLDGFSPQNIANFVWATAILGFRADPLHAELVEESMRRLGEFTTQELAMVNWALTKLAYPASAAWAAAFRNRVMQLKDYAPSEVSMIAWALATRGDYDPELLAYIARRSMELMRLFTGQNVATVIWAIATVSYKDDPSIDEFLRMALGAIIARADEFQPLNIALISWGLAKLSYKADAAFDCLCASAVRQIEQFAPQNLVQVVWACATSGYRNEEFLAAAARIAKKSIQDFSSQHLSNFLWACARLGYDEDHALLRCIGSAALRRVSEGSPQHLSNMAWAISQLGPQHFGECLGGIVAETARRLGEFDAPSLMMLSDSLYDAKYGKDRSEPLLDVLRGHVMRMGQELFRIFTEVLPARRGVAAPSEISEYQRRLRAVGLVTFGYEHTADLFSRLQLHNGQNWDAAEAASLPGWTTNARRTTVARRYRLRIGSDQLDDSGTIFTSAFASAAEDAACEFPVVWLGQGKADSPGAGRAGRCGDAECRAVMDTHHFLRRAMQDRGASTVDGAIAYHASGVPCLSCVGVAAQFRRHYPNVQVCFTFSQREQGWEAMDAVAPQGPRFVPRSTTPARQRGREAPGSRLAEPPLAAPSLQGLVGSSAAPGRGLGAAGERTLGGPDQGPPDLPSQRSSPAAPKILSFY